MSIKENKYLIFDVEKKLNLTTIIKYVVNFFERIYYGFLLNVIEPKDKNLTFKYNVSICAIFKDEADYIKEWIEYHKIVGVEHFYLYNNNSTDNYLEILKPYIDKGDITLNDWPMKQGQMQAYQHWADNYKDESKWVGFIDLDEFVVPNDNDNIYDFLKKFNKRPVVVINWKYFGSSGIEKRDIKNLVTEDFTIAWYKYSDIGKYFFNAKYDYVQSFKRNIKMHSMWGRCRGIMLPPVNVFDKVYTCSINPINTCDLPIQINHYLLKSKKEYMNRKIKKGGGVNPIGIHDVEYFNYHDSFSNVKDEKIFKYIFKLKKALNSR